MAAIRGAQKPKLVDMVSLISLAPASVRKETGGVYASPEDAWYQLKHR
jgi:hypothetical protein